MPQNLFAACRVNGDLIAKRVRLDHTVQQEIKNIFDTQEDRFRDGVTVEINFDGSWTPDAHEFLIVDVPDEGGLFLDTINANPVSIPEINTANFANEGIKAIFTGEAVNGETKVLVQRFSPAQILSRKFPLFLDGNAFRKLSDPAFTLDSALTCIVEDGKLKFKSFHKLRTIINLLEVYKEATDQEVVDFASHASFEVADSAAFLESADQTIRKLIHAISRSGTLDEYSVNDIQAAATAVGVPVNVNNGHLVLPTDRANVKTLLRFLDDGLYEAPLTGRRYITNSKRPV